MLMTTPFQGFHLPNSFTFKISAVGFFMEIMHINFICSYYNVQESSESPSYLNHQIMSPSQTVATAKREQSGMTVMYLETDIYMRL